MFLPKMMGRFWGEIGASWTKQVTRNILWKVLPSHQVPLPPVHHELTKQGKEETGYLRKAEGCEKGSGPHTPACLLLSAFCKEGQICVSKWGHLLVQAMGTGSGSLNLTESEDS